MRKVHISIDPRESAQSETIEFDAVDLSAALAIADINAARGTTEIFREGKRVARVIRHGAGHAGYWELI